MVNFGGLELRRYEDIKEIVAPKIDPKSHGTFEKQASGLHLTLNHLEKPTFTNGGVLCYSFVLMFIIRPTSTTLAQLFFLGILAFVIARGLTSLLPTENK